MDMHQDSPRSRHHAGHQPRGGAPAFTLIELLLVIVVIATLLALAVPTMLGAMAANRLSAAGEQLLGVLSEAQQMASTEGRVVEVRFYKHSDASAEVSGDAFFRSVLVLRYFQAGEPDPTNPTGGALKEPLALVAGSVFSLPGGIVMSSDKTASPLLESASGSPVPAAVKIRRGGAYEEFTPAWGSGSSFVSLIFKSEGTLHLDQTKKWCVTLLESKWEETGANPVDVPNFFCIQINPINGRLSSYRP